jgi:hypothetical protein
MFQLSHNEPPRTRLPNRVETPWKQAFEGFQILLYGGPPLRLKAARKLAQAARPHGLPNAPQTAHNPLFLKDSPVFFRLHPVYSGLFSERWKLRND